jgi:hypothetical protein
MNFLNLFYYGRMQYLIKVEMKRSFLNKDITKQIEINIITKVQNDCD